MDDANYQLLERDLRRRLLGVRLVLEIGLDEATVAQVTAAIADLVPRLHTPVTTLEKKRPALLAVYLVNLGIERYDGSLWPHQPMRQLSNNELGRAFERVLHSLELEPFDSLGGDLGHRYLTRILAHGGIPKFSAHDYLRLVIDTLRRNAGARADDLVSLWRTQRTAFTGIDEPVRRFLLYGGSVALDFLDRTIDLVSLPPSDVGGGSSAAAFGLPEHIVATYAAWRFATPGTSGAKGAVRLPRPIVHFDPWSGAGPSADLPAVGPRFRDASWRVAAAQTARLLAASLLDQQSVPLPPGPTWEIEFDNGGEHRTYAYEVLRDSAVVCFDPATGLYVPDTQPIALPDLWMLMPADTQLVSHGRSGSEQRTRVLAELPTPSGAWQGFVARHIDLNGVRAIQVRSGDTGADGAESWLRVIRPSDRAALVGEPVADVVAEGGESVYAATPRLRLPLIPGFGDDRWVIQVAGTGVEIATTAAELGRDDDEMVVLPLPTDTPCGSFDLTLRGPLGSDLRQRFCVVPGLRVATPAHLLLPGDGRAAFVEIEVEPPAAVGESHERAVRVPVPREGTELPVAIVSGVASLALRVQLPRVQWGIRRHDAVPVLQSSPIRIERDAIEAGEAESLLVATHRAGVSLALELWAEWPIQRTSYVAASEAGGRWAFALAEFRDAVRIQDAPALSLRLLADGRSAQVAEIAADVGASAFTAEPHEGDPSRTVVAFAQGRVLRNRVVRFWSLQRPWEKAVEVALEDGAEPLIEVSDAQLPPGEYRVQVSVDDGWTSARRPCGGSPSTGDVLIGTQAAALDRNLHLDLRVASDVLELALLGPSEPASLANDSPDDVAELAFDGLIARLEDETGDVSRGTRLLARVAARNEVVFIRQFARRVEDEALNRDTALRLSIHTLAEGVEWTGLGHAAQSVRSLWQVCPPIAAYVDIAAADAGVTEAGDRCEQYLGWRPPEDLKPQVGVGQNVLGMPAAQLRMVRVAMGLIPREVFSTDAWPVAMFDWLIAEKEAGEISRLWWRRYGWLADSPLEADLNLQVEPFLVPRSAPEKHPDKWAAFPRAILAAALHLIRADGDRVSAAGALLAALGVGGTGLVIHDLCLARALVEPGEVASASDQDADDWDGVRVGDIRVCRVRKVTEDGAFVDIEAHADAFLHRAEFSRDPAGESIEPIVGGSFEVLVTSNDTRFGRLRVSARAVAAREVVARLAVGDPLAGRVTGHAAGGTFLDLGFVASFLPVSQDPGHVALEQEVGAEVEVFVLAVDADVALVRLTRKNAHDIAEQMESLAVGQHVECVVTDITDFGLFAAVGPIEGLIRVAELEHPIHGNGGETYHIGDRLEAEITEIRPDRGQLTLSRRFAANEILDRQLAGLAEGDVVDTVVTSVAPMGAFVTFRGLTGLVHRNELSWTGEIDPAHLAIGSQHPAKIIRIDHDRRRVKLSFRQLTEDPMPARLAGLTVGGRVAGVVTGVVNFGAFVELSVGVDGLIHYTELPRPVEPGAGDDGVRAQVAEGSSVAARVLSVDAEKRRVSLTLRDPHPWLDGVGLPPVGARLSGSVVKVAEDGIRVTVFDRLLGVITWPDAVDLDGAPAVGSTLEVLVVGQDSEQRRLVMEVAPTHAGG